MNLKNCLVIFSLVLAGCSPASSQAGQDGSLPTPTPLTGLANLPNPASAHCEQQGYTSEIRTAADGSQSGMCIFPDGSECDEWAYLRGECDPASQEISTSPTAVGMETPAVAPADSSTPIQIDPASYQGWKTFTHPDYGFSVQLPEDWFAEETSGDLLLDGHLINIHPQSVENLNLRMTFRHMGEDVLLWPTGAGGGEFVPQGTVDVAGQPVRRILLTCPTGEVNSVYYQGNEQANIQRGDMEFGFILNHSGVFCQEGYGLSEEAQHVGDLIVASLKTP